MSITLGAVITAIRDRHPLFHKTRVTDAVFARFLSDYQNELIGKALARDAGYLSQSVGIAIAFSTANAPGTVGAGTTGGLPGDVSGANIVVSEETAGGLLFPLTGSDDGAVVVVAERVATAATANTISSTGAGRTTNQDLGRLVRITAGKGIGQIRAVASNTAAQWVVSANWTTIPDTTSLFEIVTANIGADETLGVVTQLPAVSTRSGYLVRINAQGAPYLDYTQPLTVTLARGVPLPSMLAPIGGTVRYTDGDEEALELTTYGKRYHARSSPAAYIVSGSLYLCGDENDWTDVQSIELRYAPIAPVFTALTEYFLVPDAARPALIAAAVAFAAQRIDGTEGISMSVVGFSELADRSELAYLSTLRLGKRGRMHTFREAPY